MKAPESPGKWEIVPGSSQTRSVLMFWSLIIVMVTFLDH